MPSAWSKVLGNIAAAVGDLGSAPRLLARHRQRAGASAPGLHRRARPVRPVQLGDRAAGARARQCVAGRGQGGQVLLRRPQGLRAAAPPLRRSRSSSTSSCARSARSPSSTPKGSATRSCGSTRRARSTSAPCSSRASSRSSRRFRPRSRSFRRCSRARPPATTAARSTNTSRTRMKSSPSFCRATSRCRFSARCWRMPPRSTARR